MLRIGRLFSVFLFSESFLKLLFKCQGNYIYGFSYCSDICAVLTVLYLTSEPLGGVRNLQVTDPTTSTLNVQWEPAEGNVRQYRIFYVPAAGGEEQMVCWKMVGKWC